MFYLFSDNLVYVLMLISLSWLLVFCISFNSVLAVTCSCDYTPPHLCWNLPVVCSLTAALRLFAVDLSMCVCVRVCECRACKLWNLKRPQHNGRRWITTAKWREKTGPLSRDVNQHPSVGQTHDNRLPLTDKHTHTHTHTHTDTHFHNLAIFTATKTAPWGPAFSNFHLPR